MASMREAAVSGTRMTDDCGLTERYREHIRAFLAPGLEAESDAAFRCFGGVKRQRKRSE